MYNMYFNVVPRPKNGRDIQAKQTHKQYGGYNDMTLNLTLIKGETTMTLHEETSTYSDPDGIWESSSSQSVELRIERQAAKEFTCYYIKGNASGSYLERGTHTNLEKGSISLLSTQKFTLPRGEMDEALWKILWIHDRIIHPMVGGYSAVTLKFCEKAMGKLLAEYLGADKKEAHLIIFHKFYYYGDRSDGEIQAMAQKYGWDLETLEAQARELVGTFSC